MGTDSNIPYVHHTLNFWRGCTPVSPGCANCYMFREQVRYGKDPTKVVRCSKAIWDQPYAGGKKEWKPGDRVMVCSWSDFFHPAADEWRRDAYTVMLSRPDIHWIVPTKRTERIVECLGLAWSAGFHVESLTILASVENQAMADKRIPELLEVKGGVSTSFPPFHAGISIEPMLGPVDISRWVYHNACGCTENDVEPESDERFRCIHCRDSHAVSELEWAIIGAENALGGKVRHIRSVHVHSAKCDCQSAGVPVYVKQIHYDDKACSGRLNKMPKGWPRQYPEYME